MRRFGKQLLAGPYLVWMIGFILLPLLLVVYYAFTNSAGNFTLANISSIFHKVHMKSLGLSIKIALQCTVICLLLSYPLAMILNKLHVRHQNFIVFIFILPMWMNFLLRILAWQLLLSNNGIINAVLDFFHLPNIYILNTPTAVLFGMVYDFLPYMILPIYNAMSRIRKDLIEAAQDLGAKNYVIFIRIILPLTLSGVMSGIIMVFVPALTSFAISNLLGGGKVLLIGNIIEADFMQFFNWNLGAGLSLVLMVFVIASMAVMNKHSDDAGQTAVW
ncbi:Spermidine/putrescine transport system permease protein PotB [Eubacterium plexicaudatum ASF492]|uniref:ABC transmembrane type-1 domain-containing protein n=1 Tax=Eubacterium plexicaudatum ASF492 TaxID=1235802 RepID=N2ACB9_9FIRM|nr:Spermidine/putrescine transport system permease protein PotB [Eubacterium plexicaudatum ASF492]